MLCTYSMEFRGFYYELKTTKYYTKMGYFMVILLPEII